MEIERTIQPGVTYWTNGKYENGTYWIQEQRGDFIIKRVCTDSKGLPFTKQQAEKELNNWKTIFWGGKLCFN